MKKRAFNSSSYAILYVLFTSEKVIKDNNYMKSFIAKRVNSILVSLRYLRFKLRKYIANYNENFVENSEGCKNIHFVQQRAPLKVLQRLW